MSSNTFHSLKVYWLKCWLSITCSWKRGDKMYCQKSAHTIHSRNRDFKWRRAEEFKIAPQVLFRILFLLVVICKVATHIWIFANLWYRQNWYTWLVRKKVLLSHSCTTLSPGPLQIISSPNYLQHGRTKIKSVRNLSEFILAKIYHSLFLVTRI